MTQPIAGVAPPELREVASMTVWPSIAATRAGRRVGALCALRAGWGPFTLGKLMALATIPVSLVLYFWKVLPGSASRYRLTNRRVIVQKGFLPVDVASVGLDQFDDIRIEVLPGQEWLRSGDVLFLQNGQPLLRLAGVPRPEVFEQICRKAQTALVSVRRVMTEQAATVTAPAEKPLTTPAS